MLKILPEKFLYSRLPPGVTDQDLRATLEAIVGGYQDRLEDLRTFAERYSYLLDPNTSLPEASLNVLTVAYQGRGEGGTVKRNIDSSILDNLQMVPKNEVKESVEYLVIGGTGVVYGSATYAAGKTFIGLSSSSSFAPQTGKERVYRKADVYGAVAAILELQDTEILSVVLATDQLRLVDAQVLRGMADTVGATLYTRDQEEQKRIIAGHFARLKVKGTSKSYEILGKMAGFDGAKMTPLWGRVSPRSPSDIGASENSLDFSSNPQFEPSQYITVNYDPRETADGPFDSWESGTISNDRTATNFYPSVVNGHNPFIQVLAGISEDVTHPAAGTYRLQGGGAHQRAYVIPTGSGLKFEAIAEGESFNGLPIVFKEVVVNNADGTTTSHRQISLQWKLSAIKYRTNYFNLALVIDFNRFRKLYGDLPVSPNPDLRNNPNFVDSDTDGATAPYRPYTSQSIASTLASSLGGNLGDTSLTVSSPTKFPASNGFKIRIEKEVMVVSAGAGTSTWTVVRAQDGTTISSHASGVDVVLVEVAEVQAAGDRKQANIEQLLNLGIQASHFFEELRPATRFPRQIAFGFSFDDSVIYAPYLASQVLFTSSGAGIQAGSISSDSLHPKYARVAKKLSSEATLSRTSKLYTFKGRLPNVPIVPGTVNLAGSIVLDDKFGGIPASGTVAGGTINYETGEIEVSYTSAYTSLNSAVIYDYFSFLTGEVDDSTNDNVLNFRDSSGDLAGAVNLTAMTYSFTASEAIDAGMEVYLFWGLSDTEVIRNEQPSEAKRDNLIASLARPEDTAYELHGTSNTAVVEKPWVHGLLQIADEMPWLRGAVIGGELLDKDIYAGETNEVGAVAEEMTVLDHRGIEYDIIGYDAYRAGLIPAVMPIRMSFAERRAYNPGSPALAIKNTTEIYHVGLVQGVLVADPEKFLSRTHYEGLVLWVPFNQHPEDHLVLKDHSSYNSQIQLDQIGPADRTWDEKRGWTLALKKVGAEGMATIEGYRHLEGAFTMSFWAKVNQAASTASPIIAYGPLKIELGGGETPSLSFYWNTGTSAVPVWHPLTAKSFSGTEYIHVWIRKSGDVVSVKYGSDAIVNTTQTFVDFEPADIVLAVRAGNNPSWAIHDLRIWNIAKTDTDMEVVNNHSPKKTIVAYAPTFFKTGGRRSRWALQVLDSGFVAPLPFPLFPKAPFYRKDGTSRTISRVRTTRMPGEAAPGGVVLLAQDVDYHIVRGPNNAGAINILRRAIEFAVYRKPDPKILLVTDTSVADSNYQDPRVALTQAGYAFDVADHIGIGTQNLNTLAFKDWDLVVVASDKGGWLRQNQLDVLNTRKTDIYTYVNDGGGLVVLPQSELTSRYGFLPFISHTVAQQPEAGFAVTDYGSGVFGILASDVASNNSEVYFTANPGMEILAQDASDRTVAVASKLGTVDDSGFTSVAEISFSAKESYPHANEERNRINSTMGRWQRFHDGKYQGEDRFKNTGLSGSSVIPPALPIGSRYAGALGSGVATVTNQTGVGTVNFWPAPDGNVPEHKLIYETGAPVPSLPAAPSISATPVIEGINLIWSHAPNTRYNLYRALSAGGPYTLVQSTLVWEWRDSSLTPGTTYYYRVSAVNYAGESPLSSEVSAVPLARLNAPSNLQLTLASVDGVVLSWTDNSSNETGFRIERSTDGVQYTLLATVGAGLSTHTDTTTAQDTTYYYRVAALNSTGISEWATKSIKTGGAFAVGELASFQFASPAGPYAYMQAGKTGPAAFGYTNTDYWHTGFLTPSDTTGNNSQRGPGPMTPVPLVTSTQRITTVTMRMDIADGDTWKFVNYTCPIHEDVLMRRGVYRRDSSYSSIPWSVIIDGLPAGTYTLWAIGHGPTYHVNQDDHMALELWVNNVLLASKELNIIDTGFIQHPYVENVHFVKFVFTVDSGQPVELKIKENLMGLSVINGLQILRTA